MPSFCKHENCKKRGMYNYQRGNGAYCYLHRTPNMIDLYKSISQKRKLDEDQDHSLQDQPPLKKHNHSGNKKCKNSQCNRIAIYGFPGLPAEFCSIHMVTYMINRRTRLCCHLDCNQVARYNLPDQSPMYCKLHKEENMVNRKDRLCDENNCHKIALFNFDNQSPLYCNVHKKTGMVLRKSNKCIEIGCNTRACYGLTSDSRPVYCAKHKAPNMVNKMYSKFDQPK